jgi:osmotically-inducible protein OsmY
MKTDLQLKADVAAEMAWDPAVEAPDVTVTVKNGVVTLTGPVDSLVQKHAVERAVRRVAGVRGVVVDIEVRLAPSGTRSDAELAQAALNALRWHSLVPDERLQVEVEDGWVTVRGEVDWAYQKASAEQAIHPLTGVRGVTNEITVKARADASDIQAQIEAAFSRHAQREAHHITVEVEGGVVTLTGRVDSLREHDAAVGTAYAAKGVSRVIDHLEVVT